MVCSGTTLCQAISDGPNGNDLDLKLRERHSCALNDAAEQLRSVWAWLILGLVVVVRRGHDLRHLLHITGREAAKHEAQQTRREFLLSRLMHVNTLCAVPRSNPKDAEGPGPKAGSCLLACGTGRLRHESATGSADARLRQPGHDGAQLHRPPRHSPAPRRSSTSAARLGGVL